jgi:hypothetical protein
MQVIIIFEGLQGIEWVILGARGGGSIVDIGFLAA